MSPTDYQQTMNNAYWGWHADERQRLRAQNRRLRWAVLGLLTVGTLQWLGCLLAP